jgi:hexokinase
MLVNLESGMYDGIESGDFDLMLDRASANPGQKLFEKKTAGVYLGQLCRLMMLAACDEGLLSQGSCDKIRNLTGHIDSAVIDGWAKGENLDEVSCNGADAAFVRELSLAMFRRSARCMCVNLLAIGLLLGAGLDEDRPILVCAEGSLVQRSRYYRPALEALLQSEGTEKLGMHFEFRVGSETTLPGAAAAVILNHK